MNIQPSVRNAMKWIRNICKVQLFQMIFAVIALQMFLGTQRTHASSATTSCFLNFSPQYQENAKYISSMLGWQGKCISKVLPCSSNLFKHMATVQKLSKLEYHENTEAHLNTTVAVESILQYFSMHVSRNFSEDEFNCLYFNLGNIKEHKTTYDKRPSDIFSCKAYFLELPEVLDWTDFVWQNKCSTDNLHERCSAQLVLKYLSFDKMKNGEISFSNITDLKRKILNEIETSLKTQASKNKVESCVNFNIPTLEEHLQKTQLQYDISTQRKFWMHYLIPPLLSVMLTLGIVGNIVVLVIILRYPSMRNLHNAILIHVIFADLTTLGYYCILLYSSFKGPVPLDKVGCYFIVIMSTMAIGVSQYAMVMLSAIRYLAVKAAPGSIADQLLYRFNKTPLLQAALWTLAIVASSAHISSVYYRHDVALCGTRNSLTLQCADFVCLCILPLLLIGIFSVKTTRALRRSLHNVPQNTGEEYKRRTRVKSANILVALVIVFCVSYFPFSLIRLIYDFNNPMNMARLFYVAMVLRPLNAVLNPWAVCLASRAFRRHLLCRQPVLHDPAYRSFHQSSRV